MPPTTWQMWARLAARWTWDWQPRLLTFAGEDDVEMTIVVTCGRNEYLVGGLNHLDGV